MQVDMEKLLNVPYIQDYKDNLNFKEYCEQYVDFWGSQTPEGLDSVVYVQLSVQMVLFSILIEMGIIWALDTEQTRLCENFYVFYKV